MNTSGCVSCSKLGLIAYGDSSSTNSNLCITFLETVNGINWRFHPPKQYSIHNQLHEEQNSNSNKKGVNLFYDLRSVHWNNWSLLNGELLAVCDDLGNMTMLTAGQTRDGNGTYHKMTVLFQDNVYKIHNQIIPLDTVSKKEGSLKVDRKHTKKEYGSTILDFQWIGNQKPEIAQIKAQRDPMTNTFESQMQQCPPSGVFHPASVKNACIAIRRNGHTDLWYQFSNTLDYKKISLQLTKNKESEWLRHARIAHMDVEQSFLVGMYSNISKCFSYYELQVDWNLSHKDPSMVLDPKLNLKHIFRANPDTMGPNGELLKLENFHIISKKALQGSRPEILISYNILGTTKTLVRRFEMIKTTPNMVFLSSFGVNISNANGSSKLSRYTLKHVQDLVFEHKVLDIQPHALDSLVAFRLQNGEMHFYNRYTWKLEEDSEASSVPYTKDSIFSIFATGFVFPNIPPIDAVEWCINSPSSGGVIVKLKQNKGPQFLTLKTKVTEDPSKDTIHATAFAFEFFRFNNRLHSGEDLVIAIKTHILKLQQIDANRAVDFIFIIISTILKLYGIQFEGPKEVLDKLLQSKAIQKLLLLQMELGSHLQNRTVFSMAYAAMKLRSIKLAMNGVARNVHAMIQHTALVNSLPNGKGFQFAFSKQDLIYSLIPSINWFVTFVTFLTQQLILLVNNPADKTHSLVIGIFSSITTRQLMLKLVMELKNLIGLITKFPETNYTILNESSNFLRKALGDSPVNLEKFETFLTDVNSKFASLADQDVTANTKREPYFLVKADIPPDIAHMKEFLLSYASTAMLSYINLAEVFFASTGTLRIFDSERFNPKISGLLQPLSAGLVVDDEALPNSVKESRAFSPLDYDDISSEWVDMSTIPCIKRCTRCGCITRAGNVVDTKHTVLETAIVTKRWTALYSRYCQCTGLLYELELDTSD
ncbi:HBR551Cp [Eremothecium sinecaudum]|uniref:Mediator of RNA polymerase II transcription subunit 16 n=1 Tax=Eremothecium sinecaudum TaxID=45286 RepID=A0A109UY50_9SACH|nr:HBR551Cp [Eremothecium sinecaudum]AMD19452.1 HBR551Cp [Eremothecium sinecaudum]